MKFILEFQASGLPSDCTGWLVERESPLLPVSLSHCLLQIKGGLLSSKTGFKGMPSIGQ